MCTYQANCIYMLTPMLWLHIITCTVSYDVENVLFCFVYRLDMAQYLDKIAMDNIFSAGILLSSEQILQYRCPLCKHLLDNPLQAECGDRFCSDCFKTTFTDKLVI